MFMRSMKCSTFAVLALFVSGALGAAVSEAQCNPQPLSGCKQQTVGDKGQLKIAETGGPDDKLAWKWLKGEETLDTDLGDPVATTNYTFCIYDTTAGAPALELEAVVPPGGTCDGKECWK